MHPASQKSFQEGQITLNLDLVALADWFGLCRSLINDTEWTLHQWLLAYFCWRTLYNNKNKTKQKKSGIWEFGSTTLIFPLTVTSAWILLIGPNYNSEKVMFLALCDVHSSNVQMLGWSTPKQYSIPLIEKWWHSRQVHWVMESQNQISRFSVKLDTNPRSSSFWRFRNTFPDLRQGIITVMMNVQPRM